MKKKCTLPFIRQAIDYTAGHLLDEESDRPVSDDGPGLTRMDQNELIYEVVGYIGRHADVDRDALFPVVSVGSTNTYFGPYNGFPEVNFIEFRAPMSREIMYTDLISGTEKSSPLELISVRNAILQYGITDAQRKYLNEHHG